ncbi:MAG: hypothetical protein K8R35_08530 [Bacteroidales bacterium]|nr:hypothetical protein [Bacteroidales bacterium]
MKKKILFLWVLLIPAFAVAQTTADNTPALIRNTSISGEWFLGFGYNGQKEMSSFNLKRGYFTIKTRINDIFSVRYTQDITTDREGSDMGNVEMRLKYLYLKIDLKNIDLLKNSHFEFGMVHTPWLDFEQKITGYRVQSKMFTDRYNLISSADFGITFAGLLGGEIDQAYQEKVSNNYPGRYGSFSVGVYNGGGYHAIEKNNNKIVEGRLTLRPFPDQFPGAQLSYTLSYGKSNTPWNNADYRVNLLYLSTESQYHKLMLTGYKGVGSNNGAYTDDLGFSYKNDGYSAFGEFLIPDTKFALFSRYDHFVSHQTTDFTIDTYIAGITYRFLKNKVLLHYDQSSYNGQILRLYEVALEINF